jgi:hypothetical protein
MAFTAVWPTSRYGFYRFFVTFRLYLILNKKKILKIMVSFRPNHKVFSSFVFCGRIKKKIKFLHTFLEKIRFNPARTTVAFSQNELQIAFSPICGHMQTSRGLASSQI